MWKVPQGLGMILVFLLLQQPLPRSFAADAPGSAALIKQPVAPPAEASPARQSLAHLAAADALLKAGRAGEARQEYSKLSTLAGAPAHLLQEAAARLHEIERREAGLPARAPNSSRTMPPPMIHPGRVLHVSPNGDDANPGTEAKPFASLERARDDIRSLRQGAALPAGGV